MAAINNCGADVQTEILGNSPLKRTAATATVIHNKIYFPHNILIFCANWGYLDDGVIRDYTVLNFFKFLIE